MAVVTIPCIPVLDSEQFVYVRNRLGHSVFQQQLTYQNRPLQDEQSLGDLVLPAELQLGAGMEFFELV